MLNYANLVWRNGQPYSVDYDDIYYDQHAGDNETCYVFLKHNGLPERWHHQPNFVIGEIGFGSALRFLMTWHSWQQQSLTGRLHYISVERHPVKLTDLRRCHQAWPQFAPLSEKLCQYYPLPFPGFHRLHLSPDVTLTLLFGDALQQWQQFIGLVDAWFFDGFAPKKNPACWTDELFNVLAQYSHQETTFATYSANGTVHNRLEAAGFSTEKCRGFAAKRHLLCGRYTGKPTRYQRMSSFAGSGRRRMAIIGGGLSGCTIASAAAQRGIESTLFEAEPEIARGGSGNPVGLINGRLSSSWHLLDQYYTNSALYLCRLADQAQQQGALINFKPCGLIYLAIDEKKYQHLSKIVDKRKFPLDCCYWVNGDALSQRAGLKLNGKGLLLPWASVINPRQWCYHLSSEESITVATNQPVTALTSCQAGWQVTTAQQETLFFDYVVIAAGQYSHLLYPNVHLPLRKCPGQITQIAENKEALQLKTILYHRGYLTPAMDGYHILGATYRHNDVDNIDVLQHDHQKNIQPWLNIGEAMQTLLAQRPILGRVSYRIMTPDYLPVVGAMTSHHPQEEAGRLFITTEHCSRGLSSTAMAAEIILSLINVEPLPVSRDVFSAINPHRFSHF